MKIPKHLYHYCSFRGEWYQRRLEELFLKNNFYATDPLKLNDPFDCKARMSRKGVNADTWRQFAEFCLDGQLASPSQIEALARDCQTWSDWEEVLEEVSKGLQKPLPKTGMLCFSEDADNILMWSHYADGHKGLCLQFDTDHIQPKHREMFVKVTYRQDYLPLARFLSTWKMDRKKAIRMFLGRKSKHWEYENEWRFMCSWTRECDYGCRNPIQGVFSEKTVTGMILGCEMGKEHKDLIHMWNSCRAKPIAIYEAKRSPARFAVEWNGDRLPISPNGGVG